MFQSIGFGQNPVIPVHKGITDGHIRVYDGVAYMTACHDKSIDNTWFDIDHWVLYSSTDLVNWKLEYAEMVWNKDQRLYSRLQPLMM